MTDVYTHFRTLQLANRHCPRGSRNSSERKRIWLASQVELFHLAQVIATHECISIQEALTEARRRVIHYLVVDHTVQTLPIVFKNSRKSLTWDTFQITPEISHDPALAGITIPDALARDLLTLHKAQIGAILACMRDVSI